MADLAQMPAQVITTITDKISDFGREPKRQRPTLLPNAKAPSSADELRGFGANKLILCATRASKIFALEATTSEIIWQRYLPSTCKADPVKCKLQMRLLPSSSAAYSELII